MLVTRPLYRVLTFPRRRSRGGASLVQFQPGAGPDNALPFRIGKVLWTSGMDASDHRGGHAHFETEEILVCLRGGCTVILDDGKGAEDKVRLVGDRSTDSGSAEERASRVVANDGESIHALLLFPHIWRTLTEFAPDSQFLIVANMEYDEADYIRERDEFDRQARAWDHLRGSSSKGAGHA
ncbi:sugar 3,4-ketoisomerase [Kiritimatiella glycovorans]|uniref:TDP-4-oxo-6-deoxy-alpha-D-glucose-3, 4-oxoisomerase n=1 Tax=Kiritimatiella glycovorans TaxID=1307763 RepID=A0A0G3EGN1_9BACT|nr:FdtA/QdtA family cupin domain-containing protein [Kiritimatiella glycovorans]AKJ65508.1 TDP-4-oxo-6-deoxy-alpha-D-glucose-3,4-oxoisomerase [Kiritimatiella glycovorans]